jgi:membrane protein DedA with SNARE-associated domain
LDAIIDFLLNFVDSLGYLGVYIYMLLVGTFIPVPSEVVLLPAGYLASTTPDKNFFLYLLFGSLGSLSGALINYYFAKTIVRTVLKNKRTFIAKVIVFFRSHGKISAFVGPLTPGLGQYISLPAGISHMKLRFFIPLTYSANIIWVGFMLTLGYNFGNGEEAHAAAAQGAMILFGIAIIIASIYVWREVRKTKAKKSQELS